MSNIKGENSPLSTQSIQFSIDIINYYKWLIEVKKEFVMSKQILRSGTSIGANIHEANYAASRSDFINKLRVSLKEAGETDYWFTILEKTGYYDQRFDETRKLLISIKRLLVSSINTASKGMDL